MMRKDWLFSEKVVGFDPSINESSNAIFIDNKPLIVECQSFPTIIIEGTVEWEETDVFPFSAYPRFKNKL